MRTARALAATVLLALGQSAPAAAQTNWIWPPWLVPEPPRQKPAPRRPPPARQQPSPGTGAEAVLQPSSIAPPASPPSPSRVPAPWRILKAEWSDRDEKGFEEFVQRIGESKCRTFHACLTSAEANPLFAASNPPGMSFYADCADLPYALRAYYAWKNGLPFSYSTTVTPLGQSSDIRYTALGNRVTQRRDLTAPGLDGRQALTQIAGTITSAHYRYPPSQSGPLLPDHYPVAVTRESIKPGTIIYDPNGHVAVVYKVTAEGRVHFIDTHPDNSLTRGTYGKAFTRASPGMGAGFKRWRPLTLVDAQRAEDGSLNGGRVRLAPDRDIADWSAEQVFGTEASPARDWKQARFVHNGEALDYYEFVRKRLAREGFRYDPLEEVRSMVRGLCDDLKYRVEAVDIAIKAGLQKRPQPDRLPMNIYGTDGDWETYSTPSRDARLKTAFKELRDETQRFLGLAAAGDARKLAYAGSDLRADLRSVLAQETAACTITYQRSDGSERQLGLAEVGRRLFRLSFDPYHCVERRWGAEDTEELSTCTDGAAKRAWYDAEQRLRNQIDRHYDVRMGFSLTDLQRRVAGSGVDAPPDIDVTGLLAAPPAAAAAAQPGEP